MFYRIDYAIRAVFLLANFLKMNSAAAKIEYSKIIVPTPYGDIVQITRIVSHSVDEAAKKATLATAFNEWRQTTKAERAVRRERNALKVDVLRSWHVQTIKAFQAARRVRIGLEKHTLGIKAIVLRKWHNVAKKSTCARLHRVSTTHFDKAQIALDQILQTAETPVTAVTDPIVSDALKTFSVILGSGESADVMKAKWGEVHSRMSEAQMPQLAFGMKNIATHTQNFLAGMPDDMIGEVKVLLAQALNNKRLREDGPSDESFTSPKKQAPLRLDAAMTGGAFAPDAPVRPTAVLAVVNMPAPPPAAVPVVEPAAPAAGDA